VRDIESFVSETMKLEDREGRQTEQANTQTRKKEERKRSSFGK